MKLYREGRTCVEAMRAVKEIRKSHRRTTFLGRREKEGGSYSRERGHQVKDYLENHAEDVEDNVTTSDEENFSQNFSQLSVESRDTEESRAKESEGESESAYIDARQKEALWTIVSGFISSTTREEAYEGQHFSMGALLENYHP